MTSEGINESPVEDSRFTDLDRKEDIVYQARSVPTNEFDEKPAATRSNESIDSESAGNNLVPCIHTQSRIRLTVPKVNMTHMY